jgi:hypothetical protein
VRRFLLYAAVLAFFVGALERAAHYEVARAEGPPVVRQASAVEGTYQGRTARWWARRAVQARKDANARGRTIRRLQSVARGQLAYPTGHWLDGAFLCIHRFERGAAGWQTLTGNGYHGGLQMDSSFQRTYGPEWVRRAFGESAHRWPASVQISAAIQAWTTRGFGPWPMTRRMCGL